MLCENSTDCCSEKPSIEKRPLLSFKESAGLEGLFKVLGNQTRLRMLHALIRASEMCVTDLAEALSMNPPAISNQLQRLVDRGMVASRRKGNNIFYKIVDPCVVNLIDRGLCLMEDEQDRARLSMETDLNHSLSSEQVR